MTCVVVICSVTTAKITPSQVGKAGLCHTSRNTPLQTKGSTLTTAAKYESMMHLGRMVFGPTDSLAWHMCSALPTCGFCRGCG